MYCLDCDYCLIGLTRDTCPECGLRFDRTDPATYQPETKAVSVGDGPRKRKLPLLAMGLVWSYPPAFVGMLYLTWFSAWGVLGRRPKFSYDDPVSISAVVSVLYYVTCVLMVAGPGALLIGFFVTSWYSVAYRKRFLATLALFLTYLGLWVACFGLVRWDPVGVVDWFMD
ncbi:MAG: hypothetical protein ACIAXF_01065 [Phycisphaerales bacterium JB063]